ncbi:ATPase inhibitor, partial [Penicillium daleae]
LQHIMQSLSRPIIRASATTPLLLRPLTTTSSTMGAGDTGSPKARGFLAEKDQFQRREAAKEAMYIRQLEMEKIERLRQKMKESQRHMAELDKHLEEYAKTQGGEQN